MSTHDPGPSGTPTVLVIDDDDDVREVTMASLTFVARWHAVGAIGGAEGIEVARTSHVDAILLDLMMPGMDGLTTYRVLQQDASTAAIPVVLLTAKARVGPHQPWDDLAVAGVISKPFNPMTLAAEVAAMVGWAPPAGA